MWLVRLRNPRTEPRRCSSRPLTASVGPLDASGRSKEASTSVARFFRVRPSVMISLNALGTPWLTDSINFTISSRPFLRSGSRWAAIIRW